MSKKISVNSPCPCGSKNKYKKCCQIYHKGTNPKSALILMKSRFSAFVVGDIKYIIDTSTFQDDYDDLKSFSDSCEFVSLEIISFEDDIDDTNISYVTFKANIICDNQDNSFIEKSRFIKKEKNGNIRWLYESGEMKK